MDFEQFISACHAWWTEYLKRVSDAQVAGKLQLKDEDSNPLTILYPNILLVSIIGSLYVVELIGATESFSGLHVKRHKKEDSINRYLSQFEDPDAKLTPSFLLGKESEITFSNMCFSTTSNEGELLKRFPYIALYETTLYFPNTVGSAFAFSDDFSGHLTLQNCAIINHSDNLFRCKNVLHIFIVKDSMTEDFLIKNVLGHGNTLKGVHLSAHNKANLLVVGQLQNVYFFPKLHETTIGEFIKRNPGIIHKAFETDHFEYEPSFNWLEYDGVSTDTAINPDLMIKRKDGFYDIYDLKKALLTTESITRGKRARRTFIAEVEDGLAQLANYEEYFCYQKNIAYALANYNIALSNPKLVLVIGSFDNVNIEEVKQASRKLKSNISIIDYDSLCNLFIRATT